MTFIINSQDTKISDILMKIKNGAIQLPDFQRNWIWDDSQIRSLIASISHSYPVGSLMFLEYGATSSDAAARFKYRPFTGCTTAAAPEFLVLDGQQRLTSIYSAMYSQAPVQTFSDKKIMTSRYYYLDIQKCLLASADREDAVISLPEDKVIRGAFGREIFLDLSSNELEFKSHMFPVNIIFDMNLYTKWLLNYNTYYQNNPAYLEQFVTFLDKVLSNITGYLATIIKLSRETPKVAVCQIFEKVNTGGVTLTVFELVTATFAADNFDLRSDWDKRLAQMLNKNQLLKVVSNVDFLVAATLLARYCAKIEQGENAPHVGCKRQDVLNLSLSDFKKYADILTEGFLAVSSFLSNQHIFSDKDIPYTTQIIPLAVIFSFLMLQNNRSNLNVPIYIHEKLSQWYWCGVFGEMYGSANETRFVNDVTGVIPWLNSDDNIPDTVNVANFQPTRLISLQSRSSAAYKGIIALLIKAKPLDFISGNAIDISTFFSEQIDIHHIFPTKYCEKTNIDSKKSKSIINKTPLSAASNRTIGSKAPSEYLKKIAADNRSAEKATLDKLVKSHLIDSDDLWANRFDDFFLKRAKALLGLIEQAMGKKVTGLDSEEVINAFGASLAD
ncbi:MAG: DUF262 domain-containing protein [Deltaproteobacteria bacterium]|jgi:hypothetical protein|nr:DUF262 domain-containing protein [Deltaproteobacteria bacterium]